MLLVKIDLDLCFALAVKILMSHAVRAGYRVQCEGQTTGAPALSLSVSSPDRSEEP